MLRKVALASTTAPVLSETVTPIDPALEEAAEAELGLAQSFFRSSCAP